MGGKVVLVHGLKWRLHYYAQLKQINTFIFSLVNLGENIGTVGKTGNVAETPPHLHYAIYTLIPYLWRIDQSKQSWKILFYFNPVTFLEKV